MSEGQTWSTAAERAAASEEPVAKDAADLARSLWLELFQTERSAERHCLVEADRLGTSPPALAMRAVSHHASQVLRELPRLAEERGVAEAEAGTAIGKFFSAVRESAADLVLATELSYRMTLLGVRHGIDLVTLLKHASDVSGDVALAEFCDKWLAERKELAATIERALPYFVAHPEIALAPVNQTTVAKVAQVITVKLGLRARGASTHT